MNYNKYSTLIVIGVLFGLTLWAFCPPKSNPVQRPIRWVDPDLGDYKSITWRD